MLKSGKIPQDYKDFTQKGAKKFNSKEAFLKDKNLEREYENRSYVNKPCPLPNKQKDLNQEDSINLQIND